MSSAEPPLGAGPRAAPAWQREILERKRAKLAGAGGEPEPPAGERLVVAESLGPLRENPFMRLESERRRLRQGRPGPGGAARPLQQLLELYSAVPGIRTIRADNILIIESRADPAACFAAGDAPPARRRDPAGNDPLRELLARRGAALAEIRAEQVVIYETAEPPEPPEAAEPGTVSRLLEKFGQRPRGRRRRAGDALPGTGGAAATPQVGPGAARAAPPAGPGSPRAPAPLQKGPGFPRAPAPKAAPASPPAVPATPPPLPASPRAATPPAVPPAPQPAVPQPASPQPAVPQPASPQPTVLQPASPQPAVPQPASPQPTVLQPASPQPTVPQPAAPRAATPPPTVPPRVVTPPPTVSPRAVTPQPAPPPRVVTPHPAAPQPAPAPPRAAAPPAVPAAPKAVAPQANCFVHKISPNSFTVTPRGQPPGARLPEPAAVPAGRPATPRGPPVPSASPSHARANARRPKPEEAEVAVSPLPGASPAPSATRPLSASAPRAGGSFEIHPAPKPDLAAIPAHDLQAQALAKLRLNSRNSFIFVPRREGSPARPPAPIARPGPPPAPSEGKAPTEPPRAPGPEQEEPITSPPAPLDPSVPVTYIDDIVEPDSGAGPAARTASLADQPGGAGPDLEMEFSSVPLYKPHSAPQQRGGSTFTVVPKRKPVAPGLQALADASGRPQREEEEEEEESKGRGKAVENADGPQVGTAHKKRYPTVNEIEVIGGYLSLERSCMSKTGSRRKKMKISFNETSLQTMFEYPSESSLAEEDEEEEGHALETEEKSRTFYIPRPNSTLHPSTPNSADLSSYTPKHSVKFSEWQEQKYEGPAAVGSLPKEADSHGNQVMLTPAEKGGLSDFSSEPALYF
uniref:taperin n=1 Tax=Lonchura striata TaxID=40157 RepID=UPI001293D622|nr:taperin [Lonchura striata domestica]